MCIFDTFGCVRVRGSTFLDMPEEKGNMNALCRVLRPGPETPIYRILRPETSLKEQLRGPPGSAVSEGVIDYGNRYREVV